MWDEVRGELQGRDVIVVDAPGFGHSPSGKQVEQHTGKRGLRAYASAVNELLEELAIERVVLGGLSMGGAVAAAFAVDFPEKVAGLALMDTNIAADSDEMRARRDEAIAVCEAGRPYECVKTWSRTMLSPAASSSLRHALDDEFRRVSGESLAWIYAAMRDREDCTQAVEVDWPLLLVRGADDPTCTREMLEGWKARSPRAGLVDIPDAGHFSANEQPASLARILESFVRQIEEDAGA